MLPSIFTVIKIGIGPSSSHTLGPLKAANEFRKLIESSEEIKEQEGLRIQVILLASLALTGKGHLTDLAVVAGLNGLDQIKDPIEDIHQAFLDSKAKKTIKIATKDFIFDIDEDIIFDPRSQDLAHPNTLKFQLVKGDKVILQEEYRSIGGGNLDGEIQRDSRVAKQSKTNMNQIIDECVTDNKSFLDFIYEHELKNYNLSKETVLAKALVLWDVMKACADRGLQETGLLPGELKLKRRAAEMMTSLESKSLSKHKLMNPSTLAGIYAIAVSEENAAGGKIVTSPTCGAAGVLPGVLKFLQEHLKLSDKEIAEALMLAALFGAIVSTNASIAGSEVGCQGEVGVGSSMAAAAACHIQGGTVKQIEAAAEAALEHHLGLTCDPVMGLVQIPCIERNSAGAVAAINAAEMALLGQGEHRISFDEVVETMMEIGRDMHEKYRETALGGLAKTKGGSDHTTTQC